MGLNISVISSNGFRRFCHFVKRGPGTTQVDCALLIVLPVHLVALSMHWTLFGALVSGDASLPGAERSSVDATPAQLQNRTVAVVPSNSLATALATEAMRILNEPPVRSQYALKVGDKFIGT
ncbi:MAG: hypothetical protein MHM6MM_006335 [Cercozoa sp. M6MM]